MHPRQDSPAEPVASALDRVRHAPRIVEALRDAEVLSCAAVRSTEPASDARILLAATEDDAVTAIAAVHALGAIHDARADEALDDLLRRGEEPLVSHAAWVLAARRYSPRAAAGLRDLFVAGGFTGMLAERTLMEWFRRSPDRSPIPVAPRSTTDRSHLRPRGRGSEGIVVVQPFLHARLDRLGSALGAGEAGGIASLLRSVGNSLTQQHGIEEVITITRADTGAGECAATSGHLGVRHRIERIAFGTDASLPWREAWAYRALIEREMNAIAAALGTDRRVVWHLRMADVGTLAAAAVARRLEHTVVFTAAPDPHAVIDALEADGRLDRKRFGTEDTACQYWFRARMVERLSAQADHLVLMPRPHVHRDLEELVGLDAAMLEHRSDVLAEGVDVAGIDDAIVRRGAFAGPSPSVTDVLAAIPPHRRHLPWILTVGRLHPTKGAHRIAAAAALDPHLAHEFNVVLVGGDLSCPSPDELATVELVRRASTDRPDGSVTLVGHRPPAAICDLLVHAAETGGVYVCASDKEGFGLAIVEALAAGMVVVAPRRGGPCTYIDDGVNGLLCDTSSIAMLSAAILQATTMADDRRRVAASRAFVRANLSIDTMAARLADIYAAASPAQVQAA